ncbi:hypothetical protein ABNF97_16510 [Plantactinospora sp. B6F1]|uniref:hypothetical protein n=1 Tax=Plantactinospora sp. B6F1 TaxID=3158971 RepID=UPI0032D9399D
MSDERLAHLLDQAIPGIPEELRRPPLAELRSRVRRRRTRRTVFAAAGLTLLLLTGPAVWYSGALDEGRHNGGPAGEPTAVAHDRLNWWMARMNRAGTEITVFVSRPLDAPPCQGVWLPEATVTAGTTAVTVTVSDRSPTGAGCATSENLTPLRVALPGSLAERAFLDGYDGSSRPVYREADLPVVPGGPDGWAETPGSFAAPIAEVRTVPGYWVLSYGRVGGPDIIIRGHRPEHGMRGAPDGDPIDRVEVAGNPGGVYRTGPDRFVLHWAATGVEYVLTVVPAEGESVSLPMFREVLGRIGVS